MAVSEWVQTAEDRGYGEALLDVFLFLTGDARVFQTSPERFERVVGMVEQVNAKNNKLQEVA